MGKKVLVAMSGGVDSSVAAYILKQQGYDCIGVTMRLYEDNSISKENGCCTQKDVEDAKSVANRLSIPHYTFNFKSDFENQVINRFVSSYESGATPNPCIDCNRYLKFSALYERAKVLGCDYIATGHYARIAEQDGKFSLHTAVDADKDQSYVLCFLDQERLAHTLFPLGTLSKRETRKIAEEQGFYNADKPDSQDICFIPDGDYAAFIRSRTGINYPEGDFVDISGKVLGRHRGIINYTIGQRKGLGIALGAPAYVREIDKENNRVVLCSNGELFANELNAGEFNWISGELPHEAVFCKAAVRYRGAKKNAVATVLSEDSVHIEFTEPQRAVTRGQAVVLYDGDKVLGGGTIN